MKAIIPSEKYHSEYLLTCLKIMKDWVLQYVSTAAHGTKKLNSDSLEKIMIPCPPLNIQREFVEVSEKIHALKLKLLNDYHETQNLLNSTIQKVFNGELNFDIDFELDTLIQEVNVQSKENDLSKIVGDIAYLQRLVDKLNTQEFTEKDLYDKAKHAVFQLMSLLLQIEETIFYYKYFVRRK